MIHAHLIAKKAITPVYSSPSAEGLPFAHVHKGSWLGVIERTEEWIHVLGIECEGWVRKSDVEALPPMKLHAVWTPGRPIEYVLQSKAS